MISALKLHNGLEIPALAYGTWLIENDLAASCVKNALEVGYRHIDTAQGYENEEGVGLGIKASGLPRSEICVTTKIKAEYKSYGEAKASIDESLLKLGLDCIDLILIHCPKPWDELNSEKTYFEENVQVWKAMEEAYKEGKVKAIGVSNFSIEDIENITDHCFVKPMVNQVLCHIGSTPLELIDYCKKHGIVFESYSPIAHGAAKRNEDIVAMADKYRVSFAQLCIRYTLQLGTVSIPKAKSLDHMKENTKLNFLISDEDMEYLSKLDNFKFGRDFFL